MNKSTLVEMSNRHLVKHVFEETDRPIQHMVSHVDGVIYGEYGWFDDLNTHGVHLVTGKMVYTENVWQFGDNKFVTMQEDDDIWLRLYGLDAYWERQNLDHEALRATLAKVFD